ncbi:hypothetical protein SAMN05216338_1001619 [Bradyrhizobium sp. Rc2d]|nr:hypothetical protein SAMN05216338_1001619 [Bradyrhizobium sp. Rc2d]
MPRRLGSITSASGILDRPVKPGDDSVWRAPASPSSLRAQRLVRRSLGVGGSNPESPRGGSLDCFATLAMTEQGALGRSPAHVLNCRHTFASSRRISPELCSLHRPQRKRAQGRPGAGWHPRSAAKAHAEKLHSGIQVKPNTRPSLRSGWTAYAALSREPSSFWPPSPQRKSPASRRLTQMPHPPRLDRSNDGQDHTVLPYARFAIRRSFSSPVDGAGNLLARRT